MGDKRTVSREDIVLAALSPAGGVPHTPVQVQKLLFLIDRNVSALLGGPKFAFQALHYGPFDRQVYASLEELAQQGLVEITRGWNWPEYRLTPAGQSRAASVWTDLDERSRNYIDRASTFVRSLSFPELVASIYKAYPEMRANSVFQGQSI